MGCVEIEINVICQKCDGSLDAYICISADGQQEVAVTPCAQCMEAAEEDGYEAGKSEGNSEGYDEGYDMGYETAKEECDV